MELQPDPSPDAALDACDALDCTDDECAALAEITIRDDDGNVIEIDAARSV